ncbi:MerR family transcriptional regulator [Vibrio coralliilyticus]|uniref:MerR family transcriptional regulator n=1 Tax=Vibrio TaxID=662 RepID=UPI0005073275|nr:MULTISPECIES: MerR family transcriptional regulator [Vibrio]KFI11644.1 MerR family transcriptional regulator [Vibrio sp. B183]NOI18897.1 MerR family transcriptional regulator [Vibrio coralliilyticus]
MLTVTQLAKACNVSRTTVLYYERVGLLTPATRSDNGYRWYGEKERRRLESIMSYRSFGLPVQEIEPLLDRSDEHKQEQTLRDQFTALEREIQTLRQQQKAILTLLEQPILFDQNLLTKERWVNVLRSSGMTEEDMANWHKQFERMEPDAHQEFLESLQIDADEIAEIRAMARA